MATQMTALGTQFALDFRENTPSPSISASTLRTQQSTKVEARTLTLAGGQSVKNLLDSLDQTNAVMKSRLAMLRNAADHACNLLGCPPDSCSIERLSRLEREPFKSSLRQHRYKRNSINTYWKHVQMLLRAATSLGWQSEQCASAELKCEEEWREILAAIKDTSFQRCTPFINWAIKSHRSPEQIGDPQLKLWASEGAGLTPRYVRSMQREFRVAMFRLGFAKRFPLLTPPTPRLLLAVRFQEMPKALQEEILEVLEWKQARFALGRPAKSKHRALTAQFLKVFCVAYADLQSICAT